ncbi:MAG TPA: lytic transglycosylase domain-containing protein, partial [Ktedonobacterales bacterium]|nr:lytic transglycosylase domain-containing protein [Ktedonobacterales bacterium]
MAGLDLQAILSGQPATPSAPTATASAPSYSAEDIQAMVRQAAAQYGIDPDVAVRWAQQESSFDPQAKSKKGALGVLQLMPATAQAYGVKDPTDPAQNIDGGMRYLADLRKKYGDDAKAFAAYNAGPDAVDKAGGVPNIPETKNYVQTILGNPTSNASGSAAAHWKSGFRGSS